MILLLIQLHSRFHAPLSVHANIDLWTEIGGGAKPSGSAERVIHDPELLRLLGSNDYDDNEVVGDDGS